MYESYWDSVRREKTLIEDKYSEGKAEGRAEGRAEGEFTKSMAIAKNMMQLGIPIDLVMKATGLTRAVIESQST